MSHLTDARIVDIASSTQSFVYRTPMKFGGRVVREITVFDVAVTLECRDGRRAVGRGSMPLGNAWSWPSQNLSSDETLQAMLDFGQGLVAIAAELQETAHPLELGDTLAGEFEGLAEQVRQGLQIAEPLPRLAQLVAASPVDAALHDAFGRAIGQNSYRLLGKEFVNRDLGDYLGKDLRGEYLDRYVLFDPKPQMPLYHLVGALDPLDASDIAEAVRDGLPETLLEWIAADELTHLKIKLAGDDPAWDLRRVLGVHRVAKTAAAKRGQEVRCYSLDFNERCPNAEYVVTLLNEIASASAEALERVQYIEQPTHRDLRAHSSNVMHAAARIKPVVIDEALVDFESLLLAREQGYSGVALKACKGHGEALMMGAAAQKYGLYLCVQDLTCPGLSFLHSASLAARIPTVAAIEGNARQYLPAGNREWSERLPDVFRVQGGTIATAPLDGPGLGFSYLADTGS